MEQERIPFDIKHRPEIEAGKYLVKTRLGYRVRILYWEAKSEGTLVCLITDYNGVERLWLYPTAGKYNGITINGEPIISGSDLFLVPNPDYKEPTTTCSTSVDWDAFRREAAKEFVGAILSNSALVDDRSWDYRVNVIGTGVAYADELIKQLKEGKK